MYNVVSLAYIYFVWLSIAAHVVSWEQVQNLSSEPGYTDQTEHGSLA